MKAIYLNKLLSIDGEDENRDEDCEEDDDVKMKKWSNLIILIIIKADYIMLT